MNKRIRSLRLLWIALQGVFLPLVYFSGEQKNSSMGFILLGIYEILVVADAILTCTLFEPKEKA